MATSTRKVTFDEFFRALFNEKGEQWTPTDLRDDHDRKEALKQKMDKFINELESSQFYHDFRDEVQGSHISEHIRWFLVSESKMRIVIYGIGSIESDEKHSPTLQLGLALLMKKDFGWIEGIELFDPILSKTEIQVLESLGCSVSYLNEYGRRKVLKPTMFFMPHCDIRLYNNLLEENWKPELLSNIIIFGNSFDSYIKHPPDVSKIFHTNDPRIRKLGIWALMGNILASQTFTSEFKMRTISYDRHKIGQDASFQRDCDISFFNLSWHFFSSLTRRRMRLVRENTRNEYGASVGLRSRIVVRQKKENVATSNTSLEE
ncbi:protein SENSITIVITY TO RED LIGHT REDUCED 1-like [Neltuma alba]|uniref:protein SENSITIVITY TO RED LIGHT REDUCED 1-like n=1 Tax=Neltuma alba TaxID=207710 RepID=UPI0010A2D065|nr:protein SENSITIVITY TO RED LIGHT REDUCED 1-like [Prosopis alba]XP_028779624.1 protein SENSITIVITY TO RED LIGHT REDUCED 1-like [Prosopis alba]